ncbi:uncharacterized protein [Spinacia oleracea]|uniref:Reverse transcriptase zinc-binding domain-containing protein n=1 Tax=Spinacia oleracea TaxID=3562 RepID=A0A9R0IFT7_SPIOL|nr:uncharacterized protein LOC110788032 [Spinacia oleracea]
MTSNYGGDTRLVADQQPSQAGRMQLVNSVLMSVSVYSCQIFILPKSVIRKINSVCRAYLWHGTYDDSRPDPVAWINLCVSKTQGGLGFRNLAIWNQAAVGKLAWSIAQKEDNLWVKWVHAIYVKQKNWLVYMPSIAASGAVKYICKVKLDCTNRLHSDSWLTTTKYSIGDMYKQLSEQQAKTNWSQFVWNRFTIPKHRVILWLALQDRKVLHWLGFNTHRTSLFMILKWAHRHCVGGFRRRVCYAAVAGVVYQIWKARNSAIWDAKVPSLDTSVNCIQFDVRHRIKSIPGKKVSTRDKDWLYSL